MLAIAHPWASASSYLSSQSVADSRCNPHATPRSSYSRRSPIPPLGCLFSFFLFYASKGGRRPAPHSPLLKKSLCGGGVPSSQPSLGLSVFFLSFFLPRVEESGTAPRGRRSRESKGPTGGGGAAERGRGERSDRGRSDRRENDESRKTAGWHEGCSENRRQTAKRDRKRQTPKGR